MIRLILFLFGFGLAIIGFVYIILYLNYLSIGYSFSTYLSFIIKRVECILAPIGLMLITISVFMKRGKNVLCL